jgi:phage baseplate assembly protein gpV
LRQKLRGGKRTDSRQHTRISVSVLVSGSVRVRTTGKHTRVSVSDAVRIRIAGEHTQVSLSVLVPGMVSVSGGVSGAAAVAEWINDGRHGSSGSEQQAEKIRSGEECRWKRRGQ